MGKASMRMGVSARLMLAVMAFTVALVGASKEMPTDLDLGVTNLGDSSILSNPKTGVMSLAQLRENALMAVRGEEAMSDAMVEKAKHLFVKLSASFKSESIRADSISTVRMAQHILLGE